MFTSVGDLISGTVKSFSVFVFRTSFVVREHAVAVFHGKDLIVDSAIVTVLVAQIVQLLTELSNKLVFLTASNLDSGSLDKSQTKNSSAASNLHF